MRELNLDQLRTLVTVADLLSFSEAAKVLHLSPPTVSLHISELEKRIGTRLLSRTRGNIRPMATGESLITYGRQLLSGAALVLEDISRQAKGLSGLVRIGASTGIIAVLLPAALQILSRTRPLLDVKISVLTSSQSVARVAAGALDIGIVALPQMNTGGLAVDAWRRDPVVAFLPASWKAPEFITPAWLSDKPLILNGPGTHLSQLTSSWFAREGKIPEPRIALDYNDAIKNLVGAGYGATLLPCEGMTVRQRYLSSSGAVSGLRYGVSWGWSIARILLNPELRSFSPP